MKYYPLTFGKWNPIHPDDYACYTAAHPCRRSDFKKQTKFIQSIIVVLICGASLIMSAAEQPADDVDVFMGTSNSRWMIFPGPTLPFGLVKLSPDNQDNVRNGGYEYTIGSISGFSHLHAMALSGMSLMPVVGPIENKLYPGTADSPNGTMWTSGYRSRFRKETEHASPGYYGVDLLDYHVKAELTSTMRCGLMRMTFPQSDQSRLLLDFGFPTEERTQILGVTARQTSPTEIEGSIKQKNQYALEFTVHFVLQLSRPLASLDDWRLGDYTGTELNYGTDWHRPATYERGITNFSGAGSCGLVMNFKTTAGEKILIRTGISLVSVAGARQNLEREMQPFGLGF